MSVEGSVLRTTLEVSASTCACTHQTKQQNHPTDDFNSENFKDIQSELIKDLLDEVVPVP